MNTKACAAALLVLAGCSSHPSLPPPRPQVRPGLVLIPADQIARYSTRPEGGPSCRPAAGPEVGAGDIRSVQSDPEVSAILFNRYADPVRPRELMHEAHVVYRREQAPRWRLQPSPSRQEIQQGPPNTDGRGEIRSLASQELDTFLRDQRAQLQQQHQLLSKVTENVSRLAEQQQQLARQIAGAPAGTFQERPLPRTADEDADVATGAPAP